MPSPDPISSLLRSTAAFAQLSPETCDRLASLTTERVLAPGEFLVHEGDPGDDLFIVAAGTLLLTQQSATTEEIFHLGTAGPADVLGELSLLTGHPRTATMQAPESAPESPSGPTVLRVLSAGDFDRLCADHPNEMAATLAWMTARVDAFQIAAAMEESPHLRVLSPQAKSELAAGFSRIDLSAGETLFREGQSGDALYLVLSGRIRVHASEEHSDPDTASGPGRRPSDHGKGDLLGELSLLTGEPRSVTAIAVRDSHLARLEKPAFDRIVAAYPSEFLTLFSRQLAQRMREHRTGRDAQGRPPVAITVLPLNPPMQASQGAASEFTEELVRQLSAFGPTLHLNRAVIDRVFRRGSMGVPRGDSRQMDEVAERRLLAWLDDLETLYTHIVYEADYQSGLAESAWTARCLRQADVLLVVAGGAADPRQSEQTMVRLTRMALPSVRRTLVLIHREGPGAISQTRGWKSILGIENHQHVRRENAHVSPGDVARIARSLNRQSVGLVLGGGFALGLAHIGVVDAMRDLHIPIDFVGGTSMGAIIAAAAAQEYTHAQMLEVMERGCAQALKGDWTLPLVSLLTGKKVNRELGRYLEGLDIEDLWLPWFSVSASLVHARMVVHRSGNALNSVLASCRAPGMFPPLGWEDDVLVDGGLVNNIPADVMREAIGGSGTVIAADVSPETEFASGEQFGMDLSGWRVARTWLNPFAGRPRAATLADVLMRLIRLGGVAHKHQIRASADLYMSVPLQKFTIRDFHRGEELAKVGYDHATQELEAWIAEHGRPWLGSAS